jgi:hypothetical protein
MRSLVSACGVPRSIRSMNFQATDAHPDCDHSSVNEPMTV